MPAVPVLPARTFRLSDDRKYLDVRFPVTVAGWTVTAPVRLDSQSIDRLLAGVGHCRARMADQHPLELSDGVPAMFVPDPYWHVSRSSLTGDPCISFRHPGFGWLKFELSTHAASRLTRCLLALVKGAC